MSMQHLECSTLYKVELILAKQLDSQKMVCKTYYVTSHPHVPKFGEWADGENSYPYTVCFDKARKDRAAGDKSETPNDPQPQNMPPYGESRFQPPQPRARHYQEHKTRPDNNGDHKQSGSNSNHSSKSGNKQNRRTIRPQSCERDTYTSSHWQNPPAAEHVRVKNSSKDTASGKGSGQKREAKGNRVRHNSIGDEHDRVGVALPKFGQWDVNPASSEGGYTQVFNLKREGKKNIAKSPLHIPVPVDQQLINSRHRKSTGTDVQTSSNVHTASCCFPWSKR